MKKPSVLSQRNLCFLALLIFFSGCARSAKKDVQTSWNAMDSPGMKATLQWITPTQKMEGTLFVYKPSSIRAYIEKKGEFLLAKDSLTLVDIPRKGAIEIRAIPTLTEPIALDLVSFVVSQNRKRYAIETQEGPVISGKKTKLIALKPKSTEKILPGFVERYWMGANGLPLRYSLSDSEGKELYAWEVSKITDPKPTGGDMFFKYFPVNEHYRTSLDLPRTANLQFSKNIGPAVRSEVEEFIGHSLFALGSPLQFKVMTFTKNRPLMDYSDFKKGYFAYLLQAPLVDPALAAAELEATKDEWKEPREKRLQAGHDFAPNNVGLCEFTLGQRKIIYDNFYGIKAFGWVEDGQAMTLVTSLDFREALEAISGGKFY